MTTNQAVEKPRRTGTYTAGISLIFAGIVLIAGLAKKELAFEILIRFSPLILILLGLEIIITSILFKNRPLKYDFLAGFVCLVLVCSSIGISAAGIYLDIYGPYQNIASRQKERELQQTCYQALKDISTIETVDVYADYSGLAVKTLSSLPAPNRFRLHVTLSEELATKDQFAQVCALVSQRLGEIETSPDCLSFESGLFHLRLDGPFMQNKDVPHLESYVVAESEE